MSSPSENRPPSRQSRPVSSTLPPEAGVLPNASTAVVTWNRLQVPNFHSQSTGRHYTHHEPQMAHSGSAPTAHAASNSLARPPGWLTPEPPINKGATSAPPHIFGLEQMLSGVHQGLPPVLPKAPPTTLPVFGACAKSVTSKPLQLSPGVDLTLPNANRNMTTRKTVTANGEMAPLQLTLPAVPTTASSIISPSFNVSSIREATNRTTNNLPLVAANTIQHSVTKNPTKRVESILERLATGNITSAAVPDVMSKTSTPTATKDVVSVVNCTNRGVESRENDAPEERHRKRKIDTPTKSVRPTLVASLQTKDNDKSISLPKTAKDFSNNNLKDPLELKDEDLTKSSATMLGNSRITSNSSPIVILDDDDEDDDVIPCTSVLVMHKGGSGAPPAKRRSTTDVEEETIDNIAAMVQRPAPPPSSTRVSVINAAGGNTTATTGSNKVDFGCKNTTTKPIDSKGPSPPPNSTPSTSIASSCRTDFVSVENKLEEMFAGLADDNKTQPVTSSTTMPSSTASAAKTKRQRRKKRSSNMDKKKKKPPSPFASAASNTHQSIVNKRFGSQSKSSKKSGNVGAITVADAAYDSSNSTTSMSRVRNSGPFIQIKGPRDSPLAVQVINSPMMADGEVDTHTDSVTGVAALYRRRYHDESDYRHRMHRAAGSTKGLHSSTLSHHYDAETKDTTWMCVFCKCGPHSTTPLVALPSTFKSATAGHSDPLAVDTGVQIAMGDLFGPYFITDKCEEYQHRGVNPLTQRKSLSCRLATAKHSSSVDRKRRKRSSSSVTDREHSAMSISEDDSTVDLMMGIIETPSTNPDDGSQYYEVWAHEDCIVWSPGTHLIGTRIVGLEEAVWSSCGVSCIICGLRGANICCNQRGCLGAMHVHCALARDWSLDDLTFRAYCATHKHIRAGIADEAPHPSRNNIETAR